MECKIKVIKEQKMSYKKYIVEVFDNGTICWRNQKNELHREDGPAVKYHDGEKEFWLNDTKYTEKDYWEKLKPVKKMTLAEIKKELGYGVEIVGEK